jgi:hypothetical protein
VAVVASFDPWAGRSFLSVRRPNRRSLTASLLVAALLVACQGVGRSDPVVDGWPIGPEVSCTAEARCAELIAIAVAALDLRDRGHAAVVRAVLHADGKTFDPKGNQLLYTSSGRSYGVVRFELADGSVRAIGLGGAGGDPTIRAFDHGIAPAGSAP